MSILIYQEMRECVDCREQEIIELYYDYGFKEREIAVMMGVSQQMVNYLKQKAIRVMKEYIK